MLGKKAIKFKIRFTLKIYKIQMNNFTLELKFRLNLSKLYTYFKMLLQLKFRYIHIYVYKTQSKCTINLPVSKK